MAAGVEDQLKIRLDGPAGYDRNGIGNVERQLVVAQRDLYAAEKARVAVKRPRLLRNVGVEKRRTKSVRRTLRKQAREDDAAVEIEVDEVAVRRAVGRAAEDHDARHRVTASRPVKLLVEYGVDAVVAAQPPRDAAAKRIGQRKAVA